MSPTPASTVSFATLLRRFRRNRKGDAIVQFALVAPMFFALLFAIIESALMFFATQVLETITQDSARMILTGQAQTANYVAADFKTYVCGKIPALFTCSGLAVDVQSYNSFSSISIDSHITGGAFDNNMAYNPGGPGDIVVVRVFYQWPQFVTGLGYNHTNLTGNKRLLAATAAFQNEPYN
jgi:Flp pilus assembly protein TadG